MNEPKTTVASTQEACSLHEVDRCAVIDRMARAIVDIEFSQRHTYETCMDSARERARRQAEACFDIASASIK